MSTGCSPRAWVLAGKILCATPSISSRSTARNKKKKAFPSGDRCGDKRHPRAHGRTPVGQRASWTRSLTALHFFCDQPEEFVLVSKAWGPKARRDFVGAP